MLLSTLGILPYPLKTVYALLFGILHEMKVAIPDYPNFLSKEDPSFHTFHVRLDNYWKSLRSDGIGSTSIHPEGISKDEENDLYIVQDSSWNSLYIILWC